MKVPTQFSISWSNLYKLINIEKRVKKQKVQGFDSKPLGHPLIKLLLLEELTFVKKNKKKVKPFLTGYCSN